MDETTCLWVLGTRTMHCISLDNLKRLGKDDPNQKIIDWDSLSPFPSDFYFDYLPDNNLDPFLYDSKLFLALGDPLDQDGLSSKIYQLSFNHDEVDYESQSHNDKLIPQILEAPPEDSIPPLPSPALKYFPYVLHVGGKVYLLTYDMYRRVPSSYDNFWVLEPGIREWRPLESPPPVANLDFQGSLPEFFALHDKLLFPAFNITEAKYHLYCFDIQAESWYEVDANAEFGPTFIAEVSLPPLLPDRMVGIGWMPVRLDEDPLHQLSVKLYAMLLDSKDYSVLCKQQLDELLLGIRTPTFEPCSDVQFVDLGNGQVCALIDGRHGLCRSTVLWVLVFALSWSPQDVGAERFLDVDVLVNRVFILPSFKLDEPIMGYGEKPRHAFLFSPPQRMNFPHKHDDGAYSEGTTSPPRKQPKLACGT